MHFINKNVENTIVALSTPPGIGAIGVIRLSGAESIRIIAKLFEGKNIVSAQSRTLHFGKLIYNERLLDEVVVSIFKNPNSYTGEDVVEISCHGSNFIIQEIIKACIELGAVLAKPGEFTQRAFLNGKIDLSQAESVADIIASENQHQLDLAFNQMRGGYSAEIQNLRQELIEFAALIELELDFSDEDVEFADRNHFSFLLQKIITTVSKLIHSFDLGNVIKSGIPVAIIGQPNVGKSTLLNALLQEDKAIVSDIAGTTRDFIEDVLNIGGYTFRFIDTAGLRETNDVLEAKGIERSLEKLLTSKIVLYLADIEQNFKEIVSEFSKLRINHGQTALILLNKSDKLVTCNAYDVEEAVATLSKTRTLELAASTGRNVEKLKEILIEVVEQERIAQGNMIVTNARHAEALNRTLVSIQQVQQGMQEGLSGDLLSVDIRTALQSLAEITGSIETDRDILGTVFSKFCIGK